MIRDKIMAELVIMKAFREQKSFSANFISASRPVNFSFPAHWHVYIELVYVIQGVIEVGINNESRTLCKGDMAVFSSNDIHYLQSTNSEIYLFIFNPAILDAQAGWPKCGILKNPFFTREQIPAHIKASIFAIYRNSNPQLEAEQLKTKANVLNLFSFILSKGKTERQSYSKIIQRERMQHVLEYIETNFTQKITLDQAASVAHMSRFYFSSFFKSLTGMGFVNYVNTIRVNEAEQLLINSSKNIADIAFECGFESIRTFNRVFKEVKKKKPIELRKTEKGLD